MDKIQNVQCARETQKPLKMQMPNDKILHEEVFTTRNIKTKA